MSEKPKPFDGTCQRCEQESRWHTMSWFNTDFICNDCNEKEQSHPDFVFAKHVEQLHVKNGIYNYPGVGWPGENDRLSDELKEAIQEELGFEWVE